MLFILQNICTFTSEFEPLLQFLVLDFIKLLSRNPIFKSLERHRIIQIINKVNYNWFTIVLYYFWNLKLKSKHRLGVIEIKDKATGIYYFWNVVVSL